MVEIRYQSSVAIPHQFQLLNDKTNNLDVSYMSISQMKQCSKKIGSKHSSIDIELVNSTSIWRVKR